MAINLTYTVHLTHNPNSPLCFCPLSPVQDFDRINFMLKDLGMTRSFSVYVRKYLFNAEEMLRRQTYDELVELLTPYQQREVALHRAQANLTTVPYFRDCSPELVTRLYSCLKHVTYAPQVAIRPPPLLLSNPILVFFRQFRGLLPFSFSFGTAEKLVMLTREPACPLSPPSPPPPPL